VIGQQLARPITHRLQGGLTSCAFGDHQRDIVGLFLRAESSSLLGNGCQQLAECS